MLIDIVIPVVSYDKGIFRCVKSVERLDFFVRNIIVVNQSGETLFLGDSEKIKIIKSQLISASAARNLGASHAVSDYVMFLDDDAELAQVDLAQLDLALQSSPDLVSLKRHDIELNPTKKPNVFSIPKYFIEWNMMIRRDLFMKCGGFPEIGVGSAHPAKSGEAFILTVNLLQNYGANVIHVGSSVVCHPTLEIDLSSEKARGYLFGLGYAVGYSIKWMTPMQSVYWVLRLLCGVSKRFIKEVLNSFNCRERCKFNSLQILNGFSQGIIEARYGRQINRN